MNNELMKMADVGSIALSANGMQIETVAQVFAFAALLDKAHMLPEKTSVEGAVVSIIAGHSLGLDPFQSVQGIASIKGRPSVWGDAMVAIVKASGLVEDERVEYLPNHKECQGVRYTVKRKGVATPYVGEFSRTMAEKAGLWGKTGPWTQYPDRMMLNRARAFALRDGFADVLKGFRCAEEEADIVDSVALEATPALAPAPKRKRAAASTLLTPPPVPVDMAVEREEEAELVQPSADVAAMVSAEVPDFL